MRGKLSKAGIAGAITGTAVLGSAASGAAESPPTAPSNGRAVLSTDEHVGERAGSDRAAAARSSALAFVAQDPTSRVLCDKADGSYTVIVARRADRAPATPLVAPLNAGCVK